MTEVLHVGMEIEFPTADPTAEPFTRQGTTAFYGDMDDAPTRSNPGPLANDFGGEISYEDFCHNGTRGIEARTPPGGLPVWEVPSWYAATIEEIEERFDVRYEPCGLIDETTAGLHTHVSPMNYDEAQRLYELSLQPWFRVFCGSSVTRETTQVCREGRHLEWNFADEQRPILGSRSHHNSVVNAREPGHHYEWRLPEPMTHENCRALCQFLAMFKEDFQNAENFARGLVEQGSSALTAIRRARAIGVDDLPEPTTDAGELLVEVAA